MKNYMQLYILFSYYLKKKKKPNIHLQVTYAATKASRETNM